MPRTALPAHPRIRRAPIVAALALLAAACATSPLGRSQLLLFPESEMAAMGAAAFQDLQTKLPRTKDAAATNYVLCVTNAITGALPGGNAARWEVTVFEEDSANAFALPGGKIGVHTGLLKIARDQDQLATVIGHEIGHVLAHHSNERMSTSTVAQIGTSAAVAAVGGGVSPEKLEMVKMLGGIGAQYGVILPFSRKQEAEADVIGLELMAKAGFDPNASVALWQNMAAAGGPKPPEFMSTHPSDQTRITELAKRAPGVMPLYQQARAAGRRPSCRR